MSETVSLGSRLSQVSGTMSQSSVASSDVRKSFRSTFSSLSSKVKNNSVTRSFLDMSEDGLSDDWDTLSNLSGTSEDGELEFLNRLQV